MSTTLIHSRSSKKADFAFLVFFTVMALFYSNRYIQLASQISIIAYSAYTVLFNRDVFSKRRAVSNAKFLLLWFGLFYLWALLSKNWAYGTKSGVSTLITLFRILAVGVAMFIYVTDYNKAVSVMKSFLYSNVIMAIVALVTTPLSQYGKSGDEGFGTFINQSRNVFGAVMAYCVLFCIIFYTREHFRSGKLFAIFFVVALLCSGSRGAMLQLVIILVLYVITMPGLKRKIKYITLAIFIGIIALVIIQTVPFLYDTVWVRFENMINTVLGIEVEADLSARSRELYKVLAFDMFKKRPILGFGVDGFYCYLRDVQYIDGIYISPVYSHCNFAEIASCFGIVGMLIWYVPIFKVWFTSFKLRKKTWQMNSLCILLTSVIILDYARIPWMTNMSMYTYFCMLLFFLSSKQELSKRANVSKFDTLDL